MADEPRPPDDVEAQAPAAPSPLDQYTLEDSSYDPALDAPVEAATPPEEAKPLPARAPDGKFTSPNPQHTHPKSLTKLAAEYGLSDEEIASSSPEQLDGLVYQLHRQRQTLKDEYARDRAQWERQYARPKEEPPPKEPEYQFDFGKHEDGKPVSESDLHPAVLNPLKQLAKELTAVKAELAEYKRHHQAKEQEEGFSQLDQGFADLGDKYHRVFGKGRGNDMKAADPLLQMRLAVIHSLRANPIPGMSVREATKKRGEEMFGHLVEGLAPAAPEPSEIHKRWDTAGLARPTSRGKERLPKGDKAAYRAASDWIKEHPEYAEDTGDADELNGIPD